MNAIVYDWRMWTPAELREALLKGDFGDAHLYRKDTALSMAGKTAIQPFVTAEVDSFWDVYVVGIA